MSRTIYLVKGNTGEYDERHDWIARAFFSKEKADDLMGTLNVVVENSGRGMSYKDRDRLQEAIQQSLDPNCSIDYTGAYYTIEEVEVDE